MGPHLIHRNNTQKSRQRVAIFEPVTTTYIMLKTLIQNLNHAAINHETLHIGGGEFAPSEIHAALDQYVALHMAATQALSALEWNAAGRMPPTLAFKAQDNLRASLAQIS